ncbi:hypothetical protein [Paraflavitalea speifideaquila]|uniref:hypothetical protein n=1 Tax=Paraflavitalea speifideaquila TaxID=3076558 RepID=UPI0028E7E5BC|nr:hypothetical protein [Paraflavitalea speifideiaquila]
MRNSGDILSIYSKLGLAISVWSRRHLETNLILNAGSQDQVLELKERHKIKGKVGFAAAFGLSFRIKEALAIITELNGQMISLPVSSGRYTKYRLNGRDQLPAMTTSERSWTYARSISTAAGNPDRPSTRLYEPANFSYIGLSVGIVQNF